MHKVAITPLYQGQMVLNLVYQLDEALKAEDVDYCHWKSNAALDRSASGDNDLDLLVSRSSAQRFTEILYRLGFKEAKAPLEQRLPGILDYYGYDEQADKIVHAHVHYQLVLGHDRTKNYRLPIEEPFLASATQGGLFRTPAPVFEFIVFVIRMVLKYSTWDAILGRQGKLPAAARQELDYLQPKIDRAQLSDTLGRYLPYIDTALFDACVRSLRPDCPVWVRIDTGRQLQARLRAHARRPHAIDVWLKLWRRLILGLRRRVVGSAAKKRLANGGVMIAVVGGDGAGKTTAIGELYTWLSGNFDTTKTHLGRPPWSLTTCTVRGALKIGRLAGEFFSSAFSKQKEAAVNGAAFSDYRRLLWHVCTARDRYWAYVRARRFATNGGIVICDRFPLGELKLMDGPQIERLTDPSQGNRFIDFLTRLEKAWYPSIAEPEVIVVLKVDPEIAVRRKTDEDATSVRVRSDAVWRLDWQATRAHVVDASRSKAEVLAELKSVIWSRI